MNLDELLNDWANQLPLYGFIKTEKPYNQALHHYARAQIWREIQDIETQHYRLILEDKTTIKDLAGISLTEILSQFFPQSSSRQYFTPLNETTLACVKSFTEEAEHYGHTKGDMLVTDADPTLGYLGEKWLIVDSKADKKVLINAFSKLVDSWQENANPKGNNPLDERNIGRMREPLFLALSDLHIAAKLQGIKLTTANIINATPAQYRPSDGDNFHTTYLKKVNDIFLSFRQMKRVLKHLSSIHYD